MGALVVIIPGVAIAAWLAFLFIRKGDYERGVVAFLSITLVPPAVWYFVKWLIDDSEFAYSLEVVLGGLIDLLPGLAMVGVFAALCIRWARRGQELEASGGASNARGPLKRDTGPLKPPTQTSPWSRVSTATEPSIRGRLEALEQLRRDGLVTEEEYATKRSQILSDL